MQQRTRNLRKQWRNRVYFGARKPASGDAAFQLHVANEAGRKVGRIKIISRQKDSELRPKSSFGFTEENRRLIGQESSIRG